MDLFNKQKSDLIKAIFPFIIILHHCWFLPGMEFVGKIGVTVVSYYFFMSGYGLFVSYTTRGGYLVNFVKHSIVKIFVPYIIAILIYAASYSLLNKNNFMEYLSNTSFVSWLPYSWFVFAILGGYLAFWIIFRMKLTKNKKMVLFLCVIICYQLIGYIINMPRVYYASSLAMPLGMIWCAIEHRVIKHKIIMRYFTPILIILSFFCLYILNVKVGIKIFNPVFTCLVFILFMSYIKYKHVDRLVRFMKEISYEMYLVQGVPITYVKMNHLTYNTFVVLASILIVDVALAYVCHHFLVKPCVEYLIKNRK